MLKFIKKILILFILITMKLIISLIKIIADFYEKNKINIKRITKNLQNVLKEELVR